MKLQERLEEWTDFDGAAYELGVSLGFFEDYRTAGGMWLDHAEKFIFWVRNPIGDFLFETLEQMTSLGILEMDDDHRVRWVDGKVRELIDAEKV